jgi:hypothetical protein
MAKRGDPYCFRTATVEELKELKLMQNAKTYFEQIPVAELMKKIAEEKLEIEESQPATATAKNPSLVVANTVDWI